MEKHIEHSIRILEDLKDYKEGKKLYEKYADVEHAAALSFIISLVKNNDALSDVVDAFVCNRGKDCPDSYMDRNGCCRKCGVDIAD